MNRAAQLAVIVALAAVSFAVGLVLRHSSQDQASSAIPPAFAADGLMTARLPDTEGKPQALEQWRGKVLVVNFWATWCAPCREEIPAFMKVQDKWSTRGLQIVGIAIDDIDKIRPYLAELKINYPVLVAGADGVDLTRQAGNRLGGLPFTVVFDRKGGRVHTQLGGINQQKLEALLEPLL
jgi:thiol-disulfide isomerase/thioredoxin